MKRILFLGVLLLASPHASFAQFAGGAAGYGGGGTASVYRERVANTPQEIERQKRQPTYAEQRDDGTSTFIEASVLMNAKADEYVAVFGIVEEGKTPEEATTKMDTTVASFKTSIRTLGIAEPDIFVDFVAQNRIYAYRMEGNIAKEELVGFEIKKNVSIHFKDKLLVDQLAVVAARSQIYDLIKVDYVVKDAAAIQARLQAQTFALLKHKLALYQNELGVDLSAPTQVIVNKPGLYFPVEQYASYTASESEIINVPSGNNYGIQKARKSRTTYFNPLSGDGFDTVINPVIIEPTVQFTTYMKVKCEVPNKKKKQHRTSGFGAG